MVNELKPCPFCGSNNIYIVNDSDLMAHHGVKIEWAIGCKSCRWAEVNGLYSKEDSTVAWNTRHKPQQ